MLAMKNKMADIIDDSEGVSIIYKEISEKRFPYWIIILILMGGAIIWRIVRKLKVKNEKS